jgi:predicted dehydrogenase
MAKTRIGIIGCGGIAGVHLEGYQLLRQHGCDCFEITAVCDPVEERTAKFADQIGGFQASPPRRFDTVEKLLAAGLVDGVDVCTLHADHHVTCVQCLEAGVHAMVEKPLGVTVRAARRIQEAAQRTGRVLSVAENSRRGLGQRAFAWLLNQDRRLGSPRLFSIEYLRGPSLPLAAPAAPQPVDAVPWRQDRVSAGGGWTFDGGVHLMDSLLVYFGPLESVYAEHRTLDPQYCLLKDGRRVRHDGEDTCIATFRFASGVTGHWTWSQVMAGVDFMRVAFYCEHGYVLDDTPGGWTHTFGGGFIDSQARVWTADGGVLSSRDLELEYLLSLGGDEKDRLFPHGVHRGIAIECHEFIDCIRRGRRPEVDAEVGLAGLAVSAALYESAACGQAVRVDDVLSGRIDAYQRPIDAHWGLI